MPIVYLPVAKASALFLCLLLYSASGRGKEIFTFNYFACELDNCVTLVPQFLSLDEDDVACIVWDSDLVANRDSPNQTICPNENTELTLIATDYNGDVVGEYLYKIHILSTELAAMPAAKKLSLGKSGGPFGSYGVLDEDLCMVADDLNLFVESNDRLNASTQQASVTAYDFTKEKYYELPSLSTVRAFLKFKTESDEFKFDRFIDLYNLSQSDDFLYSSCSPGLIAPWEDLINFRLSGEPLERINSTDHWDVQRIEDAYGSLVNLDYFAVHVSELPYVNGSSGRRFTPKEMMDYFRLNINSFAPKFSPDTWMGDSYNDAAIWNSNWPLGAILNIDLGGLNDGDVICGQYLECCWIFSTLHAPAISSWEFTSGIHPVSGNRMFGYTFSDSGVFTLYTMGADRTTTFYHGLNDSSFAFDAADKFWRQMQKSFSDFVKGNGGTLSPKNQTSERIERPRWEELLELLKSRATITSIPCHD